MGRRVRKVGVGGVESGCGVGGVKGRKSWDRGVGSEEVEVGGIEVKGLELGGLGGGVRRVGVEEVEVGGVGVGGVGVSEVGVG